MIITLTEQEFIRKFKEARPNNFTDEGLRSLYEYFEEYDEGIEFDPIAFCVEFTEYESLNEFYGDYDQRLDTYYDLNEYTTVIPIDDYSFIIANF
tara:strand:- start:6640 stop:6924 length:285 start_codon:yes stop_codon:yes gene_type:complete